MPLLSDLYRRTKAWIFPVSGWRKRLQAYQRGQVQWPIPGTDVQTGPFPLEWCIGTYKDGQIQWPGIVRSLISGREIHDTDEEREDALACCRCGIQFHRLEAGVRMEHNLSVPVCPWCAPLVSLT